MKMRHRVYRRRWTQQEIAELKRLAAQHVRVTAIARELGRPVSAVEARAAVEGINLKEMGRKLLDQWWPMVEAARNARMREAGMREPLA
jgi:hypothetical protein